MRKQYLCRLLATALMAAKEEEEEEGGGGGLFGAAELGAGEMLTERSGCDLLNRRRTGMREDDEPAQLTHKCQSTRHSTRHTHT